MKKISEYTHHCMVYSIDRFVRQMRAYCLLTLYPKMIHWHWTISINRWLYATVGYNESAIYFTFSNWYDKCFNKKQQWTILGKEFIKIKALIFDISKC